MSSAPLYTCYSKRPVKKSDLRAATNDKLRKRWFGLNQSLYWACFEFCSTGFTLCVKQHQTLAFPNRRRKGHSILHQE
jgi:hypothetical protein